MEQPTYENRGFTLIIEEWKNIFENVAEEKLKEWLKKYFEGDFENLAESKNIRDGVLVNVELRKTKHILNKLILDFCPHYFEECNQIFQELSDELKNKYFSLLNNIKNDINTNHTNLKINFSDFSDEDIVQLIDIITKKASSIFINRKVIDNSKIPKELSEFLGDIEEYPYGRFLRLGKIGKGGMSEVNLVWDLYLEKPFAQKVIPLSSLKGANKLFEKFWLEAILANKFSENKIYNQYYIPEENKIVILQDYIVGSPLNIYKNRVNSKQILYMALKILEKLQKLHDSGFVFPDMKPQNILVIPGGDFKLIDYGFVQQLLKIPNILGEISFKLHQKAYDEESLLKRFSVGTKGFRNLFLLYWLGRSSGYKGINKLKVSDKEEDYKEIIREEFFRSDIYGLAITMYYIKFGKLPLYGNMYEEMVIAHGINEQEEGEGEAEISRVKENIKNFFNFVSDDSIDKKDKELLEVIKKMLFDIKTVPEAIEAIKKII